MPVILQTPDSLQVHRARFTGDRSDQTVRAAFSRARDLAYIATEASYADTVTQEGKQLVLLTVPIRLTADLAAEALALVPPDAWPAILDQAREYRADHRRDP